MKAKKEFDLRVALLETAAQCFSNRYVKGFDGKKYFGEDAIQYGYELIAFTQYLDRKFKIN